MKKLSEYKDLTNIGEICNGMKARSIMDPGHQDYIVSNEVENKYRNTPDVLPVKWLDGEWHYSRWRTLKDCLKLVNPEDVSAIEIRLHNHFNNLPDNPVDNKSGVKSPIPRILTRFQLIIEND